jgi:hypothetical protein
MKHSNSGMIFGRWLDDVISLLDEIAVRKAPAAQPVVTVKPLVWEPLGNTFHAFDALFCCMAIAECPAKYDAERSARIIAAMKARHPGLPVIAFPREAGAGYIGFARATGADCVALDNSVTPEWGAANVQKDGCVQGNLDPAHMITGGAALDGAVRHVLRAFSKGPHIFNLGHGITPDADPENVARMIAVVRGG